ncbi:hypothetical protein Ancab_002104 [Ancistrocladus abbreviatus]
MKGRSRDSKGNVGGHSSKVKKEGETLSQVQTPSEREDRRFERSSLIIDPNYILKLSLIGCLGYKPPASVPTWRYYEINLKTIGSALFGLFSAYLRIKLYEQEALTYDQADAEVATVILLLRMLAWLHFMRSLGPFMRSFRHIQTALHRPNKT